MENLEQRIQLLEKRCRLLTRAGFVLLLFVAYASFSGAAVSYRAAKAQMDDIVMAGDENAVRLGQPAAPRMRARARRAARNRNAAADMQTQDGSPDMQQAALDGMPVPKKDPKVVEGEIFILKDSQGNIRGVWTADDETTSFAMTYKEDVPIIGMSVDQSSAVMTLKDSRGGKIALSLANSIRSVSVWDDTEKNYIYMGLTGSGDAALDVVSELSSSMLLSGKVTALDFLGDKTALRLADTVGGMVTLQAGSNLAALDFRDYNGINTMQLSSIAGETLLRMNSTAKKEIKTISTQKDAPAPAADGETVETVVVEEVVPVEAPVKHEEPVKTDKTVAPAESSSPAPTASAPAPAK